MATLPGLSTHRLNVREQVRRHPLVAYAVFACAITWIAWPLNKRFDLGIVNGFGIVSLAGPALAAVIISALVRPETSGVPIGKHWRSFGMIGLLALAVMSIVRLSVAAGLVTLAGTVANPVAYPGFTAFLGDVLAAAAVAFIFSGFHSPRQDVRDGFLSLDPRYQPVRWYWWAIALGLYPSILLLGAAISTGLGLPLPTSIVTGPWYWFVVHMLIMFPYFIIAGGGLEEPGWRGFALPLLQKRHSPLRSSLILAIIWAFWHLPMLQYDLLSMVFYLLLTVAPLAILFTVIFNRTGGSLPIAILLHTSINLTEQYLPASTFVPNLLMVLMMLAMGFWMWRSAQKFSV